MKHWYCSTINVNDYEPGSLRDVCDECEAIEKDKYKVEQIVYANGKYRIFYSKKNGSIKEVSR